jgi:hypothetical protein
MLNDIRSPNQHHYNQKFELMNVPSNATPIATTIVLQTSPEGVDDLPHCRKKTAAISLTN